MTEDTEANTADPAKSSRPSADDLPDGSPSGHDGEEDSTSGGAPK